MNVERFLPNHDIEECLDRTGSGWEELRDQRIFITGGTGFFGGWLLRSFIGACERHHLNAKAVVLTRDPDRFRAKAPQIAAHPAIQLHAGDVRRFDFPSGSFSHVIHAATDSSGPGAEGQPLALLDTIVDGTRRVLEFACQVGVKKMLLTSSGAVYGKQPPELSHVPETYPGAPDPTTPRAVYGEGKRMAELLCAAYSRANGIEIKIARGFAFVGPGLPLDAHFAIGNFIRDGLRGGPIVVQGDGTPLRSYLYAADLAAWLWTILFKGQSCRPYNVGSDQAISIAELAQTVATAFEPRPVVKILQTAVSGKPPERYVPDITRAQTELGLSVWTDLDESIRRTAAWARSTANQDII